MGSAGMAPYRGCRGRRSRAGLPRLRVTPGQAGPAPAPVNLLEGEHRCAVECVMA